MSLVNFKKTNHPQQVKVHGPDDRVDDRITPTDLYEGFNSRFFFTLDVAASAMNKKTDKYYDLSMNGLQQSWAGERVWCNPPYSNIPAWIYKAHTEIKFCENIVMLLPSNRTEQAWWQRFVEPFRDGRGFIKTEFVPRRRNFGVPGNEGAVYNSAPPFGLVAIIFQSN